MQDKVSVGRHQSHASSRSPGVAPVSDHGKGGRGVELEGIGGAAHVEGRHAPAPREGHSAAIAVDCPHAAYTVRVHSTRSVSCH